MIAKSRSASRSDSELVGSSKTIARRLGDQCPGDLDQLLRPHAQIADLRLGPDVGMFEKVERLGDDPAMLAATDQTGPDPFLSQQDIRLHAEMRRQGELLVDHGHPAPVPPAVPAEHTTRLPAS